MIGTSLVFIVLVVLVIYAIFDWQRLSRDLYSCPKCKANGQDIQKIGDEGAGENIRNRHIFYSRKLYSCKKCKYTWTLSTSFHKKRNN
ncbi:hypothetical protein [Aquimarina sp. SS2-1]|uniref:hypothetical protein n=1 Tax=Aquimarina besae TaxID=3342247 RepID=UPI00366DA523